MLHKILTLETLTVSLALRNLLYHCTITHSSTVLEAFDDTTGFDDYQDSYLLSEDNALITADLFSGTADINFEPADETIERDISLVPYQHYSPPSESICLFCAEHVLTRTSFATITEPISSAVSIRVS